MNARIREIVDALEPKFQRWSKGLPFLFLRREDRRHRSKRIGQVVTAGQTRGSGQRVQRRVGQSPYLVAALPVVECHTQEDWNDDNNN